MCHVEGKERDEWEERLSMGRRKAEVGQRIKHRDGKWFSAYDNSRVVIFGCLRRVIDGMTVLKWLSFLISSGVTSLM